MHEVVASLLLLLLAAAPSSRVGAAAQQPGAAGVDGLCTVRSGPELARALSNESCSVALIVVAELTLADVDWEGIATPVQLKRSFAIRGSGAVASWPHFRPTAKRKVELLDGAVLIFEALYMNDFRGDNILRAPGLDLLAASPAGTTNATVLAKNGIFAGVCFTEELMGQNMRAVPRTIGAVGPQRYTYPSLQQGCINSSDAPPFNRCWPLRGEFIDVQTPGFDIDFAGLPSLNNYKLVAMNISVVCEVVMTEECIFRLGPIGCLLFYSSGGYNGTSPALAAASPPPPPLQPGAATAAGTTPVHEGMGGGGSGRKDFMPILVGSTVGGTALLVCMSVLSMLFLRKKRRLASSHADGKPFTRATLQPSNDVRGIEEVPMRRCGGGDVDAHSGTNTTTTTTTALSQPGGTDSTISVSDLSMMLRPEAPPFATATTIAGGRTPLGSLPEALPLPSDSANVVTAQTRVRGVGFNVRLVEGGEQGSAVDCLATNEAADGLDGDASGQESHLANTSSTMAALGDDVVQLLPKVLGKGAFGKVYVGMFCGQRVAVKMVDQAFPFDTQSSWRSSNAGTASAGHGAAAGGTSATEAHTRHTFKQELEVMGRCQHPNIVRILAACMEPPRPFLVMELMDIALDKLMYAKGPALLPLDLVMHIAIEIARGLAYLHPTIIHRDLKPGNVLINDPWGVRPVVKISDFGLSRLNSTILVTQSPEAGTPAYVAPECFDVDNNTMSYKADMYSFGVLLWEMLAGARPWEGLGAVPIAFQIAFKGSRLPVPPVDKPGSSPSRWPPRLCEVLQELWDPVPERRPAAAELAKRLVLMQQRFQASDLEAANTQ